MKKFLGLSLILITALGVATPSVAHAADPQNVSIPASACQVANPNEIGEARLIHGSWVHNIAVTGTVTFICPVGRKPDGGSWTFERMRLWYRDPDGMGASYDITATLFEREPEDTQSVDIDTLSSSDFNAPGNTTNGVTLSYPMADPAMYYIRVELHRANDNAEPAFHGIDFRSP